MSKTLKYLLLVTALGFLLVGCAVYVTPANVSVRGNVRFGIEVSDIIQTFEPNRGNNSVYRVGEDISFRVRTKQSGYLSITEISPSGEVNTFARNIFIRGNETTLITGPDSRSVFSLVPPRGLHRVRLAFTPSATDTSRVTYRGIVGEDRWTQVIITEIRPYDVRDIAETRFFLE